MKILLTLFVLLFSSSVFADQYTLTCISDKNFMTVFKIDDSIPSIERLSSKNLNTQKEFNNINRKLKIININDKIINTLDISPPNSITFGTFYLEHNVFIDTAHYLEPYNSEGKHT